MNGESFEKALKEDSRTMKELATLFDVVPSTLYDIFKKEAVPPSYIKKAKELGIILEEKKQHITTQDVLTIKEAMEYTDKIVQRITDQHNVAMEEMKRVLRVYEGIMKKNKILN